MHKLLMEIPARLETERLGFRLEGHLRDFRVDNDERYGLLHFGMLKTEFSDA